jgi:ferredoxin
MGGAGVKLIVSGDLCTGHGRCYSLAGDLLDHDDEGYVTARGEAVDVPPDQADDARNAVGSCPERAIRLLDD